MQQQNGAKSKSYVWSDDDNDEVDSCGRDDEKNNKKEEKPKTASYVWSDEEIVTTGEEIDETNSHGKVKYNQESSNDSQSDAD